MVYSKNAQTLTFTIKTKLTLLLFSFSFTLFLVACSSALAQEETESEEVLSYNNFNHENLNRDYILYIPAGIEENAPLVFVLHGYSGSANLIRNYSAMNAVAKKNGFAVCYPQGIKDDNGYTFWNVGYDFHQNQTVNDSGFLNSLAIYLQETYALNPEHTFVTGMSNGGDMCYRLACEHPETFKAIAPVTGCMMQWIYEDCPKNAIPVLKINGDNDTTTLWEGDLDNKDGYGAYLPTLDTFNFWATQNDCTQLISEELPNNNVTDGSSVTKYSFSANTTSNKVILYRVNNGGHDWPGSAGNMDINSSSEIWSFFQDIVDSK